MHTFPLSIYHPINSPTFHFPVSACQCGLHATGFRLVSCAVCLRPGPQIEQPVMKVIRSTWDRYNAHILYLQPTHRYLPSVFLHIDKSYILVIAGWPPHSTSPHHSSALHYYRQPQYVYSVNISKRASNIPPPLETHYKLLDSHFRWKLGVQLKDDNEFPCVRSRGTLT